MLASVCLPSHSCIPNAVFTGSALQCEYQRDRALLVNKPSAGWGGEKIKTDFVCDFVFVCVFVCVCPITQSLLKLFWQRSIMYLLVLITWIAHFRSWFMIWSLRLYCCLSCNQEDLIQCTDPDSLQVSTKDMDSTLSKASRAIKKTSKKVKAEELVSPD